MRGSETSQQQLKQLSLSVFPPKIGYCVLKSFRSSLGGEADGVNEDDNNNDNVDDGGDGDDDGDEDEDDI